MGNSEKKQNDNGEKTMRAALLLSSPGPIATGIPAILSRSATQIGDFIRRTTELVAILISWLIYRKIQKQGIVDEKLRLSLERKSTLAVGIALLLSGLLMLLIGISRFFVNELKGRVIIGLLIASLGLLVNFYFWIRYRNMLRDKYDSIIEDQCKLYRAKVFVDVVVVLALAFVTLAPDHLFTKYIDAIGGIIVSFYLLYNGGKTIYSLKKQEV